MTLPQCPLIRPGPRLWLGAVATAAALLLAPAPADAQPKLAAPPAPAPAPGADLGAAASDDPAAPPTERIERQPSQVQGLGIDAKLGDRIPLDLVFTDQDGRAVRLGDYFDGERPVILNLGYYRCPMLCSLVINGLTEAVSAMDWPPGKDYRVVTLSIDPSDTPELAKLKQQEALSQLGAAGSPSAWPFLVGDETRVRQVADAVGFGYRWLPDQREFAHAAVIMVLTPDGTVSRYLYGVKYPARTLRLSLVEASDGGVGSAMDQILLFCFQYSEQDSQYALAAVKLMRLGGVVTLVTLAGALWFFFTREGRKSQTSGDQADIVPR